MKNIHRSFSIGNSIGLALLVCWGILVCLSGVAAQDQVIETPPSDTVLADSMEATEVNDSEVEEAVEVERLYTPPAPPAVPMRKIEEDAWTDASGGLDYSKDVPKPEKKRNLPPVNPNNWNLPSKGFASVLQAIAILVALLAIAYAIYRTLQAPRNRRLGTAEDGVVITAENVDAYIHETDLERFLRQAIEAGNYSLAIRLYYLQIIKILSEKNMIKWSRDKTNRDYLRETREYRFHPEFREATRDFEKVWYGNELLNAEGFAALEPGFRRLMTAI